MSTFDILENVGTIKKEFDMEKRKLNISFYKAGYGTSCRLTIPRPWIKELGISPEEKEVDLIFDKENNQLIIKKRDK